MTLFKSVGLAVQDLVTAKKIYSLAKESNVGTKFILWLSYNKIILKH